MVTMYNMYHFSTHTIYSLLLQVFFFLFYCYFVVVVFTVWCFENCIFVHNYATDAVHLWTYDSISRGDDPHVEHYEQLHQPCQEFSRCNWPFDAVLFHGLQYWVIFRHIWHQGLWLPVLHQLLFFLHTNTHRSWHTGFQSLTNFSFSCTHTHTHTHTPAHTYRSKDLYHTWNVPREHDSVQG